MVYTKESGIENLVYFPTKKKVLLLSTQKTPGNRVQTLDSRIEITFHSLESIVTSFFFFWSFSTSFSLFSVLYVDTFISVLCLSISFCCLPFTIWCTIRLKLLMLVFLATSKQFPASISLSFRRQFDWECFLFKR